MFIPLKVNQFVEQVLRLLDPYKTLSDVVQIHNDSICVGAETLKVNQKLHLFAAGKAASYELVALKKLIFSSKLKERLASCVAITKAGQRVEDESIIVLEGDHPLLSPRNIQNTQAFISHLEQVPAGDSVVFLLSGGASALLEWPIEGLDFSRLQKIHADLLASGKNINEMNQIRKALSKVKNGGLLDFIKTDNVLQLITCDIPNENINDVSSGPLLASQLDYERINEFLADYALQVEARELTTKPVASCLIQSASLLLNKLGFKGRLPQAKIYDDLLENIIPDIKAHLPNKGEAVLSGGEATIVVPSKAGIGGRNTHFVLQFASELYVEKRNRDIEILSIGSDGCDGPTDAAGAYINYDLFSTLAAKDYLANFDSYSYFSKLGTIIKTGATKSNLMDIRLVWRD